MITTIPDRERALQARVDALTAELARLRAAIQTAYGYLWCVNNEPGTPIDLYPPEKAAYEARKVLRDLLTTEQRGQGINSVLPTVRSAPPAQPAEPTIDEQVASVNAVFDAWRNGEDATLTLAAQPAEPVQRLSDERAAFEAWHNEYRTQELVRRDDTYYNTHVRCRWEGWQARAIESALQPGWRDIESAPKDDETVWLHCDGKVIRGFWCEIDFKEYRDADGNYIGQQDQDSYWMSCVDGDAVEPTEWMPITIPPAPKASHDPR